MLPSDPFIALISRPKMGLLRHVGVYLPGGYVAHCLPERGEHISSIEQFAAGKDVTIDRVLPVAAHVPTLERVAASMQAPRAYDLLRNNCEMYASRAVGEKPKSPQLVGIAVVLIVSAIVVVAISRS